MGFNQAESGLLVRASYHAQGAGRIYRFWLNAAEAASSGMKKSIAYLNPV
jgi:hypothetical protein